MNRASVGDDSRETFSALAGGECRDDVVLPGRIGSNVADDGELFVLSLKVSATEQGEALNTKGKRVNLGDGPAELNIKNTHHVLPAELVHCAAGLADLDHQAFQRQYRGWTVRDYQTRDAKGYAGLYNWLERREEEYRSGVRIDTALPLPTREQRTLGANTLIDVLAQARTAMANNRADFRALRLSELPSLPLRSFMMKRLALRNAELVPLVDLGEQNAYRQACLQFLLPARVFSQSANPKVDAMIAEGVV